MYALEGRGAVAVDSLALGGALHVAPAPVAEGAGAAVPAVDGTFVMLEAGACGAVVTAGVFASWGAEGGAPAAPEGAVAIVPLPAAEGAAAIVALPATDGAAATAWVPATAGAAARAAPAMAGATTAPAAPGAAECFWAAEALAAEFRADCGVTVAGAYEYALTSASAVSSGFVGMLAMCGAPDTAGASGVGATDTVATAGTTAPGITTPPGDGLTICMPVFAADVCTESAGSFTTSYPPRSGRGR